MIVDGPDSGNLLLAKNISGSQDNLMRNCTYTATYYNNKYPISLRASPVKPKYHSHPIVGKVANIESFAQKSPSQSPETRYRVHCADTSRERAGGLVHLDRSRSTTKRGGGQLSDDKLYCSSGAIKHGIDMKEHEINRNLEEQFKELKSKFSSICAKDKHE